jgi:hypothetical protein
VSELQLPEELKGAWEHALFMSYGADLPFFERTLARQLPAGCRNRIVLADRRQYLAACIHYARGGQVRTLNQQYVADGIRSRAMHAKLILLTSPHGGRLFVGSGNLGFQGYASGGELFTFYEYGGEGDASLPAFIAARQFIERLAPELSVVAQARITHLLEHTPWLFQAVETEDTPVRHNLDHSFIDQLVAEVGGASVSELLVAAPFYDRDAAALNELVIRLAPRRTRILLQRGRTSVDPAAIDLLAASREGVEIVPFTRGDDDPYVHAKLILARVGTRTVCLQGSSNLSRVALLQHGDAANIEVANLLNLSSREADGLLGELTLEPVVTSAAALHIEYAAVNDEEPEELEGWHLVRGDWREKELRLYYAGTPPPLAKASVLIGDDAVEAAISADTTSNTLTIALNAAAQESLQRAAPVSIRWVTDDEETKRSNPVYVFNLAALERVLEAAGSERLPWIGSLDGLEDDELEHLLQELADALIIDQGGLWRLAGRGDPPSDSDHEEELELDYADIDYEALRQHPKIAQYAAAFGSMGSGRSRLQIILNSIAAAFGTGASGPAARPALAAVDEATAETEDELEIELEERERRQQTLEAHLARIFQNFIRRYLRGATTRSFEERVGAEVVAQNYLIFSFILWRLFRKPWMPTGFLGHAFAMTHAHFWGADGFIARAEDAQRDLLTNWLREKQIERLLLATVYQASQAARADERDDVRLELRDIWREVLRSSTPSLQASDFDDAVATVAAGASGQPPSRGSLATELRALADFETRTSFCSSVATSGAAWFEQVSVRRPATNRTEMVDCFVLRDEVEVGEERALAIVARWMRFEKRTYYRLHCENSKEVCYYDALDNKTLYWAGPSTEHVVFAGPPRWLAPWDNALTELAPNAPGDAAIGGQARVA